MFQSKSALFGCLAIIVVLLSLGQLGTAKRDYRGYSVIRGLPQTLSQLNHLNTLMVKSFNESENEIQFWTAPTALNHTVDILVSPERRALLEDELSSLKMPLEKWIEDVGQAIRKTRQNHEAHPADNVSLKQSLAADQFYKQFQRYSAIEAKIRELERLDPRVSVEIIGQSTEKRNLYLVRVSNDLNARKPIVLIDGGHHAREWISHATVMYLLESLVNIDVPRMPTRLCKNEACRAETVRNLARLDLNKFDYWFIPVVNPDGYEHSHVSDRLWRKTRSGSYCRGADPNRNYPFHWNESGSSSFQCSEIYSGTRPRSEPEVRAVVSVMDQYKDRIQMYLSFHCYSQLILAPYGYARVYPNNYNELAYVASAWLKSMNRLRGTDYQFGTSAITLYPSSGGSDDYAHSIGIPLAYTIELPDKGNNGFITPPSEIIPIAHETLIGVQSMIDSLVYSTKPL
uniref:Carboxypeptidase B n=1 Tax=Aceria tosichella TaxID=561515 RepID=A0A6G1SDJ0_9ACAR